MRTCLRLKKINSNILLTLFLLFSPFLHNDLAEFFAELGIILLKIRALTCPTFLQGVVVMNILNIRSHILVMWCLLLLFCQLRQKY